VLSSLPSSTVVTELYISVDIQLCVRHRRFLTVSLAQPLYACAALALTLRLQSSLRAPRRRGRRRVHIDLSTRKLRNPLGRPYRILGTSDLAKVNILGADPSKP
jgi:hypothetical protein